MGMLADGRFTVSAEEREQCTRIIDAILKEADLSTIGAKKIRKGLAKRVDWDISDQLVCTIRYWEFHYKGLGLMVCADGD